AEPKRKKKFVPSLNGKSVWSSNAAGSSIGFKLMSSMGWAPGKGLGNDLQGEKDNIKYALKDDLLGVGAKKEFGGGVWRGMGEVDDLYRRLEVSDGRTSLADEQSKSEVEEKKQDIPIQGRWKVNFQVGDTYTSSFSREESEVEGVTSAVESSAESLEG